LSAGVIASPVPNFEDFGIEIHFTPFLPAVDFPEELTLLTIANLFLNMKKCNKKPKGIKCLGLSLSYK